MKRRTRKVRDSKKKKETTESDGSESTETDDSEGVEAQPLKKAKRKVRREPTGQTSGR